MFSNFTYRVDSISNSFCHRSALFFHLTCQPGLKIPLPVLTNGHQSSLFSVYLVPMPRSRAKITLLLLFSFSCSPLSLPSLITCSWSSPDLASLHSHFFSHSFPFQGLSSWPTAHPHFLSPLFLLSPAWATPSTLNAFLSPPFLLPFSFSFLVLLHP